MPAKMAKTAAGPIRTNSQGTEVPNDRPLLRRRLGNTSEMNTASKPEKIHPAPQ